MKLIVDKCKLMGMDAIEIFNHNEIKRILYQIPDRFNGIVEQKVRHIDGPSLMPELSREEIIRFITRESVTPDKSYIESTYSYRNDEIERKFVNYVDGEEVTELYFPSDSGNRMVLYQRCTKLDGKSIIKNIDEYTISETINTLNDDGDIIQSIIDEQDGIYHRVAYTYNIIKIGDVKIKFITKTDIQINKKCNETKKSINNYTIFEINNNIILELNTGIKIDMTDRNKILIDCLGNHHGQYLLELNEEGNFDKLYKDEVESNE